MNNTSLLDIKEKNTELYNKAIKNGKSLSLQEVKEILKFLKDIEQITVNSLDDYQWLNDIVVSWHSVFLTIFDRPIQINLSKPKELIYQPSAIISEISTEDKIKRYAYSIAFTRLIKELGNEYAQKLRELEWKMSQGEIKPSDNDTNGGEVYFVSDIFDGRPNLSFISPDSYKHLEHVWSRDLKVHRAYFVWLSNKEKNIEKSNDENYYEACANIRDMLGNSKIKLPSSDFINARDYIQTNYLNDKGKLKHDGNYANKVNELIQKKAYRISDTTGCADGFINWVNAETYTKMFYEDIIPAVLERNKEKTLRILKSFQYSKTQRFLIINCFELALAVYFLDADIVQELWNEGKSKPESAVESVVTVKDWPNEFEIVDECDHCKTRFWFNNEQITFKGVMLDVEKTALSNAVENTFESEELKKIHKKAINDLYEQSRTIHKETTL